jgi:hypothetical protein
MPLSFAVWNFSLVSTYCSPKLSHLPTQKNYHIWEDNDSCACYNWKYFKRSCSYCENIDHFSNKLKTCEEENDSLFVLQSCCLTFDYWWILLECKSNFREFDLSYRVHKNLPQPKNMIELLFLFVMEIFGDEIASNVHKPVKSNF